MSRMVGCEPSRGSCRVFCIYGQKPSMRPKRGRVICHYGAYERCKRHSCRLFHGCGHFLGVEGDGEEGEVHGGLVLAEVPEALVLHVVLHLAEDGLGLYGTPRAVFEPPPRGEPLPRLSLELHQAVVGRYGPCGGHALVAPPAQRASLAASRLVHRRLGDEAAVRPRVDGADTLHVLPHPPHSCFVFSKLMRSTRLLMSGSSEAFPLRWQRLSRKR